MAQGREGGPEETIDATVEAVYGVPAEAKAAAEALSIEALCALAATAERPDNSQSLRIQVMAAEEVLSDRMGRVLAGILKIEGKAEIEVDVSVLRGVVTIVIMDDDVDPCDIANNRQSLEALGMIENGGMGDCLQMTEQKFLNALARDNGVSQTLSAVSESAGGQVKKLILDDIPYSC